ncbi:P-loop containing nucleoside triphosphate hydrolase protein [Xylariaceae sp. FL0016]|nr:P-loop containing nucleoside triphosphate hydrolase protein [Xylariaceae sp. FL0016]
MKERLGSGNLAILTKVDKLRELIGSRIGLPQLVVVGDQSSGKSSVLEGLTGFAFPRDAELCTRYATQITCRREPEESIHASIIPNQDTHPEEQERLREFSHKLTEMSPESLKILFEEANKAMGIKTATSPVGTSLPSFSEHILKIEKHGPNEEHCTVIDVPGIFRRETTGVTTETDIELVRDMVKKYMKDSRTIILAILPANVDPATQEILKLAKKADPAMTRTMAVLTKPDLAIEEVMQKIAVDHVTGKRSELTLGYYIVKNRGPGEAHLSLEEGKAEERRFFAKEPWSTLARTGKAGMDALGARVRELLVELIKKEFPKLKAQVVKELSLVRAAKDKMGDSRDDQHKQRTYLNKMSERFQRLVRDALTAHYSGDGFFDRHDVRLITRIVEASEHFSDSMAKLGHTRKFRDDDKPRVKKPPHNSKSKKKKGSAFGTWGKTANTSWETPTKTSESGSLGELEGLANSPSLAEENDTETSDISEASRDDRPGFSRFEIEEIFDGLEVVCDEVSHGNIMDYIEEVYKSSRGQDLGTFGSALLGTIFKEQSRNWEPIAMSHMKCVIEHVHHFIYECVNDVCPDRKVREELWNGYILEDLQKAYRRALGHAKFLLEIERQGHPWTTNHYFNDNLQQRQTERFISRLEGRGFVKIDETTGIEGIHIPEGQLKDFTVNQANSEYVREYMHDVLESYYKVARKRFVDVLCMHSVDHFLLRGKGSPLYTFNTEMVLNLNEEQLDMIAAEDASLQTRRQKLNLDIQNFETALKVLKGSA